MQLLLQDGEHYYVAQTGLVGSSALPNHRCRCAWSAPPGDLAEGQDSVSLRFESAPVGGVVLAKTYAQARRLRHRGQARVINQGAAPVSPSLYLQLVRDNRQAGSDVPFASTFTGPAFYSDAAKFEKVKFEDIDKDKASFHKSASDGYVAMVQHYFASAWLLDAGVARENYAEKVPGGNLYRAGFKTALGEIAPARAGARRAPVRRTAGGGRCSSAWPRPGTGQDYGWTTIVAKPLYWLLEKIHGFRQLGLVHRAAGGRDQGRVLLAQRQRLPQHGQDEAGQPRASRKCASA